MKDKFIWSTIILLIGGFITKIIGMLNRIILGRLLGSNGMGMYMLILPTFMLLISLGQFGLPKALSKLVSEDNKNTKTLYFSILPLTIIINSLIIVTIFFTSSYICKYLFHNEDLKISLISIGLVIPFTSISSICRSYFFGRGRMFPHVISNIVEDLLRLVLLYFLIPVIKPYGLKYTICFLILINVISEAISTIILLLFLPKNITIKKSDLVINSNYFKDTMKISIPTTTSRLIGSFAYFLEPIVLTNILLYLGYSNTYITTQYGIISGFILPILLLPSFFTNAISDALLPIISNYYSNNKLNLVKRKIIQGISLSLFIGIISTIIFYLFGKEILYFLYKTKDGLNYLYFLAPILLLEYIQSPLASSLDAMGKSIDNMRAILLGSFIRIIGLFIFSLFRIGIWILILSISINVVVVTIYQFRRVFYYLK